jgi:hypothetical protein
VPSIDRTFTAGRLTAISRYECVRYCGEVEAQARSNDRLRSSFEQAWFDYLIVLAVCLKAGIPCPDRWEFNIGESREATGKPQVLRCHPA